MGSSEIHRLVTRTMASTLTLQLFRSRKPAFSISLDSQSMMSQDDGFLTCPQPSSEGKKGYFFVRTNYMKMKEVEKW